MTNLIIEPARLILVLITSASIEGLDESVYTRKELQEP